MHTLPSKRGESGQVLLLVVLASVIALTVGLAAISRSITSTRISTEETNSQKALSAAEAGVEEQINKALAGAADGEALTGIISDNAGFESTAVPIGGTSFEINDGEIVSQDEGADIWLSDYPDFQNPTSSSITVYWQGTGDCSTEAAIEVAWIYGDSDNPSMGRAAADNCRGDRGNNFSDPDGGTTINGTSYNRSLSFNVNNGYIARVIPLYADANVAVRSTTALPDQGFRIESTGSSGDTVRKLKVYQGFPKLPIEFFPYNLFLP